VNIKLIAIYLVNHAHLDSNIT